MDTKPKEISPKEWKEILQLKEVADSWGLEDLIKEGQFGPKELADTIYGVKFNFMTGCPGYIGDLFILMGDGLSAYPMILTRNSETKELQVEELECPATYVAVKQYRVNLSVCIEAESEREAYQKFITSSVHHWAREDNTTIEEA